MHRCKSQKQQPVDFARVCDVCSEEPVLSCPPFGDGVCACTDMCAQSRAVAAVVRSRSAEKLIVGKFLKWVNTAQEAPSPAPGSAQGCSRSRLAPEDAGRGDNFPSKRLTTTREAFFEPSSCGDVFHGFDASFPLLELTFPRRRNESDGVLREDPGGCSVWRWEYKSLQPDRTSGHAVQEGDSQGKSSPGWACGPVRTARPAASCIHSRAPTWRCSPASTGADSGQTSRARLSEGKPAGLG